jgi:ribosomal-protein-alanine N-acetyltransferase
MKRVSLRTERLELREPVPSDVAELMAYDERNEERFAPWEPARRTDRASYVEWIDARRAQSLARTGRSFLAFTHDDPLALVAKVNLYEIKGAPQYTAVLGYSLDGAFEGRGYGREAVAAVVAHAFASFGLKRVVANHDPANTRSAGLLRRLGFVVEGYARDDLYLRGRWRDSVRTALLDPDWRPPLEERPS